MIRKDNNMKKDIPNANIKEDKVYLFSDGEVYTAQLNQSVYNNRMYDYEKTNIPEILARVIYDKSKEVAFSSKYNAMEFDNTKDYNYFVENNGKKITKLLCKMLKMELKS